MTSSSQRNRISPTSAVPYANRGVPRVGLTLIELVVGLVLLATLLVSILLASSRYEKSLRLAKDRRKAVQLADVLIAEWFDSPRGIPIQANGPLDAEGLVWRTQLARNDQLFGRDVRIVRLDVSRVTQPNVSELLSIELVKSGNN